MANDYAGAKAAIRARLAGAWTTTRITYQNEQPAAPWPPVTGSGTNAVLQPWVQLEIKDLGSQIWEFGTATNRGWRYDGIIYVHVFVPVGTGDATAEQYAVQIGEIFRAAKFYDDGLGSCVRTLSPEVGNGGPGDDDGNWFCVTASVDFTYWHRG
jgi:hypothetical protein